jgi:protease-4
VSRYVKVLTILGVITFICSIVFLSSFFSLLSSLLTNEFSRRYSEEKEHLAVLRIDGPIFHSDFYLKHIEAIAENRACRGILLYVNSPGGAVSASQEIYSSLKELRSEDVPVVVSMGNTAASGGYYVALGADKIFANRGTLTGSIGVIAQFPEAQELFSKLGISMEIIKSGEYKDAGSPFRKTTKEERKYLQTVVDDTYEQFLSDILANRDLSDEELRKFADGRLLTGRQALNAGLVDTLGGYLSAKNYLAKISGMQEDPLFIEVIPGKSWVERITSKIGISGSSVSGDVRRLIKPGLYYLWPGGLADFHL